MFIFGLNCIFCKGVLETLGIDNGTLSTKCSRCGHISRPKHKEIPKNTIYSKFANKSVEVQYNAKRPRSGEYKRITVANETEIYPDRKRFAK